MPESITEQVLVPNNYANKTVLWAKNDLATVGLGIEVAEQGGSFHPPGTDELPRIIDHNAGGSQQGQPRPAGGNANVILKPN